MRDCTAKSCAQGSARHDVDASSHFTEIKQSIFKRLDSPGVRSKALLGKRCAGVEQWLEIGARDSKSDRMTEVSKYGPPQDCGTLYSVQMLDRQVVCTAMLSESQDLHLAACVVQSSLHRCDSSQRMGRDHTGTCAASQLQPRHVYPGPEVYCN
jgi:hypothetical protein